MRKNSILVIIAIVIAMVICNIAAYSNIETVTAKVTDKERITEQSGDRIISYYLVYTSKGTYKLEDDLFRGNFYSSDVYGKLKRDSTYNFKTSGYRIGFMSSYPNIIKVN